MTKLTETQTIILSAGAQRPENIALPLPKGLAGAAAKMAVSKMIEHGWLLEVDANLRRNEPLWRETGDGHGTTLVVTDAGLLAIGIEPVVVKTVIAIHEHAAKDARAQAADPARRNQAGTDHRHVAAPGRSHYRRDRCGDCVAGSFSQRCDFGGAEEKAGLGGWLDQRRRQRIGVSDRLTTK